ncbi:MAG: multicopper oxidase domain-containing protein [Planctomycetota bacterium]
MRTSLKYALMSLVALASLPAAADVFSQCPNPPDPNAVCLHLTAGDGFVNMADRRPMYCFGFHDVTGVPDPMVMMEGMVKAEFPGPTIVVKEGQRLYLNLTNVGMMMRPDLFDPHTVHFHGFPQAAPIFDGMPMGSISINMGATLTYFYELVEPGTFMYHCHVEATEHMQMGMLANIWVLPKQNDLPDGTNLNGFIHHTGYKYAYNDGDGSTYYDVDYPLQFHAFDPNFHDASLTVQPLPFAYMDDTYAMFNGRGYPDTVDPNDLSNASPLLEEMGIEPSFASRVPSLITATVGQKVLLRISSLATVDFFTVTALGVPMRVVGAGARLLRGPDGKDLSYETNSVTLGGGEAMEIILDTTDVAPGTYALYTTNLNFLSNDAEDFGGMMTEIVISAAGPAGPQGPNLDNLAGQTTD